MFSVFMPNKRTAYVAELRTAYLAQSRATNDKKIEEGRSQSISFVNQGRLDCLMPISFYV